MQTIPGGNVMQSMAWAISITSFIVSTDVFHASVSEIYFSLAPSLTAQKAALCNLNADMSNTLSRVQLRQT